MFLYQSNTMKEKKENKSIHKDLNLPIEGLADNPFTVPTGYFEGLEERILFHSRLNVSENAGFQVPKHYFDQLEQDILARVSEDQLKEKVDADGFVIPEGYFEGLSGRVMAQVAPEQKHETVIRKLFRTSNLRYAAAACILIASMFMVKEDLFQSQLTLEDIPDQELIQYLQVYGGTQDGFVLREYASEVGGFSDFGDDLSDADIEWYLENTL